MSDIAVAIGAKFYSEKTGDDLSLLNLSDLGHVDKIIVGKESSVLIKNDEISEEVKQRIEELREQQSHATRKADKDFINERIASLAGAIGCIYVGGNSDVEQKEKYDRVEDSVCAVKSAMQEGIVAGGGTALYRALQTLPDDCKNKNKKIAYAILKAALSAPLCQIIDNAGMTPIDVITKINTTDKYYGFDVKNEKFGNMYEMGVIDPLKVTKNALLNAVSVATTILSTNAIVTHARVKS